MRTSAWARPGVGVLDGGVRGETGNDDVQGAGEGRRDGLVAWCLHTWGL